eukprot:10392174-Lingulodinium_polyedra.AAC.1
MGRWSRQRQSSRMLHLFPRQLPAPHFGLISRLGVTGWASSSGRVARTRPLPRTSCVDARSAPR